MNRSLLSMLAFAALAPGLACASPRPACATSGICGTGFLCVAGSCRPKNEIPTETGARKLELLPDRWTVITSKGPTPWNSADVPLGRASAGHVLLLLNFPSPLRESARVVSAFVVLEPMPGMTPGPSPVPISVSRILRPWTADDASWTRLPELSPVESTLLASNWGMRPLYVDVTRQVSRWREQRADDQGIAISASPHDPIGASYSLGLAGGRGPRLEIYIR